MSGLINPDFPYAKFTHRERESSSGPIEIDLVDEEEDLDAQERIKKKQD